MAYSLAIFAFSRAIRFGSTEVGLVVSEAGLVVSAVGLVVSEAGLVVSAVGLVVSEAGLVVSAVSLVVSAVGLVVSELRLVVSSCACKMNTEKRRGIKKTPVLNKNRCMGLYSNSLEMYTVNVCLYV
jgi:hypothetical protein